MGLYTWSPYALSLIWLIGLTVWAAPQSLDVGSIVPTLEPSPPANVTTRAIPAKFPFKVCCVGDSITVGVGDGSPPLTGENNGYRLDLYDILTAAGFDPQFIGSQVSGTDNPQPNMEGYGWQTIDSILNHLHNSTALEQQPNLVLIHAGTNDMDYSASDTDPTTSPENAPYRLGTLIDYVNCIAPNAVVLVAQVIQNKAYGDGTGQANTNAFNAQVPSVVGDRYMAGFKVRVVDLSMIGGDELYDWLHPTAPGYLDMANRWYSAIQGIPDEWWSTDTTSSGESTTGGIQTCSQDAITFNPAIGGNFVANGYHVSGDPPEAAAPQEVTGDTWVPGWGDNGIVAIGCGYVGSGVQFADLNGDGKPDYLWVNLSSGAEGEVYGWLNGGVDVWNAINNAEPIAFGYSGAEYVEFADLDGDGLAELIIVADGQFRIWHNGGPNGNVWSWSELPTAENELDYIFVDSIPYHWFADITGSGRADLIVYDTNGGLDLYINNGAQSDGGFDWTQCKTIGIAPNGFLIFADINGDGRADYINENSEGGLSGFLNNYTSGCSLNWITINGGGFDSLAFGSGETDAGVRMADLTGDGKADYLTVADTGGAVHLYPNEGSLEPIQNSGIGGYAAAVRLKDMNGDGLDDYVSVTDYSGIAVYLNGGPGADNTWIWNQQDQGNVVALGYTGATRQEVTLADMNADGYDDYLVINATNGELVCYLNLGPSSTGSWNWDIVGLIAIGVGGVGDQVRVADFDGDGKADYIYIDNDGSATVWLDSGPDTDLEGWAVINSGSVAALGVGAAPEDITFADIDGDGKADFCWLHPDTGALEVWFNGWDGTTVGWIHGGVLNPGQGYPGRNIRLARIGTSGRHDYVALEEDNGAFKVWFNNCSDVIGTKPRPMPGACGSPPMPTQSTSEAVITPASEISVDSRGQTVIQGGNGVQVTLPLGITPATTITESDSAVITYITGGNTQPTTIVNSAGITILQGSEGEQTTLPTGMSQVTVVTEAGGEVITYDPKVPVTTASPTTNTGTNPAGGPTATTSSSSLFFIFGITTYVPSPTSSGSTQQLPCNLWFFFICISWQEIDIQGWQINWPTGTIIPPGPPPAITIPGIQINTIGPMPTWPAITIGNDGIPTFTPDTEPDNCETETGSICMTSTSYGVSGTETTTTSITATCSVVYGCNPTETTSSESTTETAASCPVFTALPYTPYTDPYTLTYAAISGSPARTTILYPAVTLPPTNAATGTGIPTDTALNPTASGSVYECTEGGQGYSKFTYSDYQNVTTAFCNDNTVLTTSNQNGLEASISVGGNFGYTVNAFVQWAVDQTGCSPRANFAVSSTNHNDASYQRCLSAFLGPFQCNGVQNPALDSTSWGGLYVYSSPSNGCLLYELYANS